MIKEALSILYSLAIHTYYPNYRESPGTDRGQGGHLFIHSDVIIHTDVSLRVIVVEYTKCNGRQYAGEV